MALIKCDFFSEVLTISTSMTVILPEETSTQIGLKNNRNEGKIPTLYLLHGFSDDHTIWTRRTSIERYAAEYGIAVVMPQVDHSFYADMEYGKKYWTFISEELPRIARSFFPLSSNREDNFVAGLSMGGYGAFKWALRKPQDFAAAASLSGVLDIANHVNSVQQEENPVNAALFHVYGDSSLKNTEEDLFYLIRQLRKTGESIPKLFQACGTEDFLWEDNKKFHQYAEEMDLPLAHTFTKGTHEWGYWDEKIQEVLAWLPIRSR
ncbi:alpha/beta hydrolase [Gracilibacillus kekensis]|uniref:S-formylglutathione hydrolase FrmB n=1 Tax=Gracilibacillus kekensis TaxID=1027249 RepID=A0A1M7QUT1_9BACI|nr:alpha/beta hydrolase family protein [Gracilibacillus kekensis]SHN35597.1 S-formylglutathione hydrolase FrmB [Gracilibacillus kekensis]